MPNVSAISDGEKVLSELSTANEVIHNFARASERGKVGANFARPRTGSVASIEQY